MYFNEGGTKTINTNSHHSSNMKEESRERKKTNYDKYSTPLLFTIGISLMLFGFYNFKKFCIKQAKSWIKITPLLKKLKEAPKHIVIEIFTGKILIITGTVNQLYLWHQNYHEEQHIQSTLKTNVNTDENTSSTTDDNSQILQEQPWAIHKENGKLKKTYNIHDHYDEDHDDEDTNSQKKQKSNKKHDKTLDTTNSHQLKLSLEYQKIMRQKYNILKEKYGDDVPVLPRPKNFVYYDSNDYNEYMIILKEFINEQTIHEQSMSEDSVKEELTETTGIKLSEQTTEEAKLTNTDSKLTSKGNLEYLEQELKDASGWLGTFRLLNHGLNITNDHIKNIKFRMQLISFWINKGKTHSGYTAEEIVEFSDREIDEIHDFIQWAFPNSYISSYNKNSPVIRNADVQFFRSSIEAKNTYEKLLQRYKKYLFNGNLRKWNGHDLLRIHRIIRSIKELEGLDAAKRFHQEIIEYTIQQQLSNTSYGTKLAHHATEWKKELE